MAIRISSAEEIPDGTEKKLKAFTELLREQKSFESLLRVADLHDIAIELDELCISEGILGYHYTRADKASIVQRGLLLTNGANRRRDFFEQHGHRFTDEQQQRIKRKWDDYFRHQMRTVRDSRIWFNFTHSALRGGGAEYLLKYYGGEQVYFPICDDPDLAQILTNLGQPMIVECALNPADLTTFSENAWGKIWLSSYHVSLNPDAFQHDVDAYQTQHVEPGRIRSIQILESPFSFRSQ